MGVLLDVAVNDSASFGADGTPADENGQRHHDEASYAKTGLAAVSQPGQYDPILPTATKHGHRAEHAGRGAFGSIGKARHRPIRSPSRLGKPGGLLPPGASIQVSPRVVRPVSQNPARVSTARSMACAQGRTRRCRDDPGFPHWRCPRRWRCGPQRGNR